MYQLCKHGKQDGEPCEKCRKIVEKQRDSKRVYQRCEYDCLQAVLSTLLNIKYDDIPEFYKSYMEHKDSDKFEEDVDAFLEGIGFYRITVPLSKNDCGGYNFPFVCSLKKYKCVGVLKKEHREYSHAVILKIEKISGELSVNIFHDPKRETDYDIDDLTQIEFIIRRSYL